MCVCERTKPPGQPRLANAIQSRRFNDRVFLDIVFIENVNGDTFSYLTIMNASTYQVSKEVKLVRCHPFTFYCYSVEFLLPFIAVFLLIHFGDVSTSKKKQGAMAHS